eukprot:1823707-Pleurochrysis_carterae.AAC.1
MMKFQSLQTYDDQKHCSLAHRQWVNFCTLHILVTRQKQKNQGSLGALAPPGGVLAPRPPGDAIAQKSLPYMYRNREKNLSVMQTT